MSREVRVVLADDEPLARQRLLSLLRNHADMVVAAECANGLEALAAVAAHRPDLLLLDVEMPGLTGLDVLARLGPTPAPVVIFITAYDEHAVRAFEHQALDYVLKPIDEDRFARALQRARERLDERSSSILGAEVLRRLGTPATPVPAPHAAPVATVSAEQRVVSRPDRFLIRSGERLCFVPVADIDWIEAEGDYVRLHTGRTSQLLRSTLGAVEEQIDPAVFVRIHRSTIVRTARIHELEPYFRGEYIVVLSTGARLKMSRTYRDRLQAALRQEL